MNCEDLDKIRDQGSGRSGDALPQSAREHLRECEACRNLQGIWEASDRHAELSAAVRARVASEILPGLRPVSPLPSDRILMSVVLVFAGIGIVAGASLLGAAGWRALAIWQAAISFSLLAAGIVVMARHVTRQMTPGTLQPVSTGTAIFGTCATVLTAILLLFPYAYDPHFFLKGIECWKLGLVSSLAAGALFLIVLRRGAWLAGVAQGASAGLLSGLVGLTVLEIHCPVLDRAHRGVWHFGAALTAVLLGTVLAALSGSLKRRPKSQF